MATIITVHGTGATGAEEGQAWWQKSSPFESHIRELVESEDGVVTFQPVIWDGENSESSRRTAGKKLFATVAELEKKGERYCLIGHSHGGSVISSALVLSAFKRQELPLLGRWITIGTPFLQFSKAFWLFSRVSLVGKSALVTLAAFYFWFAIGTVRHVMITPGAAPGNLDLRGVGVVFGILGMLLFVLVYLIIWLVNRRTLYMYRRKIRDYASGIFGPRWISLCHRDDEAVVGLGSLKNLRINLFKRDFAVPAFAFLSIFAIPAALLVVASSPTLMRLASSYIGPIPQDGSLWQNLDALQDRFIRVFDGIFPYTWWRGGGLVDVFVLPPLALFILALVVTYSVTISSHAVSNGLSKILDRLAWGEIRRAAFGGDVGGQSALHAGQYPIWGTSTCPTLPEVLSHEITDLSNKAASQSLAKFRAGMNQLLLAEDKEAKSFFFSEYLNWDELIHTCYFNVPHFRMLVAYAIGNTKGFRPSAAFKNHPDYDLVTRWYEEIQPKPVVADERSAIRTLITNLQQDEQKKVTA